MCRHLWSLDFLLTSVVFVPNAPTTMGITFSLTPHIIRISLGEIFIFFLLSRPLLLSFFHHLELPRLKFGSSSLFCQWSIYPVSCHVMVCSYTKIPQHLVILIWFSWQVPMDCSSYVVMSLLIFFYLVPVLDTHIQYGWWSRCFVCTFYIWDRSVSCRLLLLHDLFLLLDLVLQPIRDSVSV